MKQVIQASGVLAYEPFGFTNCVRFKDVLYLSGISAIDPEGKIVGADIETRPRRPTATSRRCCAPPDRTSTRSCR